MGRLGKMDPFIEQNTNDKTKGIEFLFYLVLACSGMFPAWNNFWEQFFGDKKLKSGY